MTSMLSCELCQRYSTYALTLGVAMAMVALVRAFLKRENHHLYCIFDSRILYCLEFVSSIQKGKVLTSFLVHRLFYLQL